VTEGTIATPAGEVSRVSSELTLRDKLGRWKARWAIGRMKFVVAPGLYAAGSPTSDSPVFVSANYKMSFDYLRSRLQGRDGWILVLDTRGINVWCAAGKGTFGTEEIVRRLAQTRLAEIVTHRRLILPQLGGPGVAAHEVKERTGFRVIYGPIRADDLPAFLDAGLKATDEMRLVRFSTMDRLILAPVELVTGGKYFVWVALAFFLLAGLGRDVYSVGRLPTVGGTALLLLLTAYLAGGALTPLLLPWLPGRAFAFKGAVSGLLLLAVLGLVSSGSSLSVLNWWDLAAWVLLVPTVASFVAMNFTGSSTYTSLSGVRKEMRTAVPIQIVGGLAGLGLWIAARFV